MISSSNLATFNRLSLISIDTIFDPLLYREERFLLKEVSYILEKEKKRLDQ